MALTHFQYIIGYAAVGFAQRVLGGGAETDHTIVENAMVEGVILPHQIQHPLCSLGRIVSVRTVVIGLDAVGSEELAKFLQRNVALAGFVGRGIHNEAADVV